MHLIVFDETVYMFGPAGPYLALVGIIALVTKLITFFTWSLRIVRLHGLPGYFGKLEVNSLGQYAVVTGGTDGIGK